MPVEDALGFERLHEILVGIHPTQGRLDLTGDRLRLVEVVREDPIDDLVGNVGDQRVPLVTVHDAGGDLAVEQDLEVDLSIGAVDAARVVDEVGVDLAAVLGVLDTSPLGEPKIAALDHCPASQIGPIDSEGVVRPVADLLMGLA